MFWTFIVAFALVRIAIDLTRAYEAGRDPPARRRST